MPSAPLNDVDWLNGAAQLAWRGISRTSPNPLVGAILVGENGEKISEGWHDIYGEAHAETNALANVTDPERLKGATLYVTLEPCSHQGKQPPCADQLISIGLKRVVYALKDPNPLVAGKGAQRLKEAGLQTDLVQTQATHQLNEVYQVNHLKKRAFFHLKSAITLDGKLTLNLDQPTPLSNEASLQKMHQLRARHDAILIGKNTLAIDNPRLTNRFTPTGHQPIRIVLDTHLSASPEAQIFKQPGETWICHATNQTPTITAPNVKFIACPTQDNRIDLTPLASLLYQHNIRNVLVEGGSQINASFLKAHLVDRLTMIMTPHLSSPDTAKNLPCFIPPEANIALENKSLNWCETDLWLSGNVNQ